MEKNLEYVLGINRHHNGSVCLLKDGEIVLHIEEERLSRFKTDNVPILCFNEIKKITDKIDIVGSVGFHELVNLNEAHKKPLSLYDALVYKICKNNDYPRHDSYSKGHHLCHAALAFYNSGFKDAICIVVDGNGSEIDGQLETESVFTASYPAEFKCIYKKSLGENDSISVGHVFESVCEALGFEWHEAGKVMGLAAYGKLNKDLPKIIINGRANPELFEGRKFVYQFEDDFSIKADIAYAVQHECQELITSFILDVIEKTNAKNICLSGGYFLNCVANYKHLKRIPKDVNLYIEPISGDAGLSIGVAKHIWHSQTGDTTIRKQKSLYYGPKQSLVIPTNTVIEVVTPYDVAKLIYDGNIVALFQGRSESGPRALGNRSILFNPCIENGKEIINTIKKRESFRPFAGTILVEKAHEWFDMDRLEQSPFMLYAVDCLEDKKKIIPSIVHEDGTCRIQTLSSEQNVCYHSLIKQFERISGVPILFNTSFNLAGDPLVETLEEAIDTLKKSKIEYLYLPEKERLIVIRNYNES